MPAVLEAPAVAVPPVMPAAPGTPVASMALRGRSLPLRVGVIVFPGSNCDRDAGNACAETELGEPVYLWHQDNDLQGVDAVILPGGFSYGDALRAGAIARFAPMMNEVAKFAEQGGPVLAICNGFQVACEAGLLPGALVRNEKMRFACRHVGLRVETIDSAFTGRYAKGETLAIPVAHGEGRFVCDDETHARLVAEDKIAFRYVPLPGQLSNQLAEDFNPNGSRDDIAGILGGPNRNILGMMPHPERAVRSELGSPNGRPMFEALFEALCAARSVSPQSQSDAHRGQ